MKPSEIFESIGFTESLAPVPKLCFTGPGVLPPITVYSKASSFPAGPTAICKGVVEPVYTSKWEAENGRDARTSVHPEDRRGLLVAFQTIDFTGTFELINCPFYKTPEAWPRGL